MIEESVSYKIAGMTCVLCSSEIENKIRKLNGVKNAKVSYSSGNAKIIYDKEKCSHLNIEKCITSLGFYIDDNNGSGTEKYIKHLRNTVILSFIFTIPLIISMLLCNVEACCVVIDPNYESTTAQITAILRYKLYFLHSWKIQMALAIPVQFIFGKRFYKNALSSILNRKPGMDILVSLGSITAFGYSTYCIYKFGGNFGKNLYFESGAMMISFILLGKYLEALTRRKTNNTLNNLRKIQVTTAVVEKNGVDSEVEINDIKKGDVIIITPGKQIPLDGTIIEGESFVDESLITGESMAVSKKKGSRVFGGTINTSGSFKFKVEKTIEEGVLSDIISLLEEAQISKPEIQKITDKICGVFVPAVITLALVTFLYWFLYKYNGSLYYIEKPIINAVCVLVISCPCALGLATPIAVTLETGIAADNGILIKRGEALEYGGKIDTVIFDKTGTLTENRLTVKNIISYSKDYDENELLSIGRALEKYSEHPIGKALCETRRDKKEIKKYDIKGFESVPGKGVKALLKNQNVFIGNRRFLEENNIEVVEIKDNIVIYIGIEDKYIGAVTFEDAIRKDAKETVRKLKESGIQTLIVSGDKKDVCEKIAKTIGIDKVYYEVLPQDKYKIVKKLQEEGRKVAMIGDGINDLTALSRADLSIAIKDGTDIAAENSDVVIINSNLKQIPLLIELSKKTMRKIKENLIFAFIYNIVGIPIAAAGFLKPEIACILMTISSLSVVFNTLLLKKNMKKRTKGYTRANGLLHRKEILCQ